MGERRKPHKTVIIKEPNRTSKIEVFDGSEFGGSTFRNLLGELVNGERNGMFRLRINGRWFPARGKVLYDKKQLNRLLMERIGE